MSVAQELEERKKQDESIRRTRKGSTASGHNESTDTNVNTSTQYSGEVTWRKNPEIDAKIDQYIAENPDRKAFWESQTEHLVRQALLKELTNREVREERYAEVQAWMDAKPGRREEVMARVRNVPPERQQAAIISAAERVAADEGIGARNKPRQYTGRRF